MRRIFDSSEYKNRCTYKALDGKRANGGNSNDNIEKLLRKEFGIFTSHSRNAGEIHQNRNVPVQILGEDIIVLIETRTMC